MQVLPPRKLTPGKVEVPCANCGEMLPRYRSRLKRQKFFFCNKNCFESWRAKEGSEELIQQLAQEGRWRVMEERGKTTV